MNTLSNIFSIIINDILYLDSIQRLSTLSAFSSWLLLLLLLIIRILLGGWLLGLLLVLLYYAGVMAVETSFRSVIFSFYNVLRGVGGYLGL